MLFRRHRRPIRSEDALRRVSDLVDTPPVVIARSERAWFVATRQLIFVVEREGNVRLLYRFLGRHHISLPIESSKSLVVELAGLTDANTPYLARALNTDLLIFLGVDLVEDTDWDAQRAVQEVLGCELLPDERLFQLL